MSAAQTAIADRAEVEAFIFSEAALLDSWCLQEWLDLFTDDGRYVVPSTDVDPLEALTVDPRTTLCLVHDDRTVLRARVHRLLDKRAHAANPRPRVRHQISNVRLVESTPDALHVQANFLVSAARNDALELFVGGLAYQLVRQDGALRIRERRAVLDLESLSPMGQISFIL